MPPKKKSRAKKTDLRLLYELDRDYNKSLKKYVEEKQSSGEHPKKFEFPVGLQFELTSKCNLRCKHCYNYSGENVKADRMSPEDWLALSKDIVKNGGLFECIISGGEPLLLGDKLIPIMDTLHEDKTVFIFITNGFLLDREWVDRLKKYTYSFFQVSIDGFNEKLHDDFRGVKGSFERAVRGAFDIANEGIHLRIAHSVHRANKDSVDKMADLAYKIGASSIILGESTLSGRAYANEKEMILTAGDRNDLCRKIGRLSDKYAGRMQVYRSSFTKTQLEFYRSHPNAVAIVRPDGNVRLDCMAPFIIGNVKERPFIDIWREKAAKCWHDKKVTKYVNSFRGDRGDSCLVKNYKDADILI